MLQDSPSRPPWLPRGELAHCPQGAGVPVAAGELGSGRHPGAQPLTRGVTLATRFPLWARVVHMQKKSEKVESHMMSFICGK